MKEQWRIYKRGQVGGRNSVSIPQVGGLNPSLGAKARRGQEAICLDNQMQELQEQGLKREGCDSADIV